MWIRNLVYLNLNKKTLFVDKAKNILTHQIIQSLSKTDFCVQLSGIIT